MDGVVEIITRQESRRRWRTQDKVWIVAESNEPGSVIRPVVTRHGGCESLAFSWRRQAHEDLLNSSFKSPVFAQVHTLASASTAVAALDQNPGLALWLPDAGNRIEPGIGPRARVAVMLIWPGCGACWRRCYIACVGVPVFCADRIRRTALSVTPEFQGPWHDGR